MEQILSGISPLQPSYASRLTLAEFKQLSIATWGERWFEYRFLKESINIEERIKLHCKFHNTSFMQIGVTHLNGHNSCPHCATETGLRLVSRKQFIDTHRDNSVTFFIVKSTMLKSGIYYYRIGFTAKGLRQNLRAVDQHTKYEVIHSKVFTNAGEAYDRLLKAKVLFKKWKIPAPSLLGEMVDTECYTFIDLKPLLSKKS